MARDVVVDTASRVTLRVHEAGDRSRPTVVLCHGFPELAYSWRHQVQPLVDAGYHVLVPDQRGYGASSAPEDVAAYHITHLCADLLALLDDVGKDDAVFVGHDWGALIVWDLVKLHPQRVRGAIGVSVPFVQWPAPPTSLMRAAYGDRFFYILYFQPVGPAEAELEADVARTMSTILHGGSGAGMAQRPARTELPPMEGTGFLTHQPPVPPLPLTGPEGPWLDADDLAAYVDGFTRSGFFGPLSYYRNLDADFETVRDLDVSRVSMPSAFIGGELDPVNLMDPTGVERMRTTLPDFRGAVILPGVGHWTQQESPAAFNAALLDLLRRF